MDIYCKLPEDLKDIVVFHLNKHLEIHYLNKIYNYFSFNPSAQLTFKCNHKDPKIKVIKSLNINNMDYQFNFPYKITNLNYHYAVSIYRILDNYNNEFAELACQGH